MLLDIRILTQSVNLPWSFGYLIRLERRTPLAFAALVCGFAR